MWQKIKAAPADPILGLTEAFNKDENPKKVNLGVGVYKDNQGQTPVLDCVKTAEKLLLEKETSKNYLPISGDGTYANEVQKLLFGKESEVISAKRAATAHAPGGTGALRVGGELIKKFNPDAKVWISTPTWANHKGIFTAAGFHLDEYSYYDAEQKCLDFDGMMTSLAAVPPGDVVLLHACCHNPSGVDPSDEQWQKIAALAKEKGWLPFLDFAYQGFAESIEADRCAIREFANTGVDFLVASSFSKNFGLYNERVGAITVVSPSAELSTVAMSHLKATIRTTYSNPPAHGGLVVATVLANPELKAQWIKELTAMSSRIREMRAALVEGLAKRGVKGDFSSKRGVKGDFSCITAQHGMFSFSGLTDEVVSWLRENRAIYVVGGGRINLAGLTSSNIDYVCDSIAEALQ